MFCESGIGWYETFITRAIQRHTLQNNVERPTTREFWGGDNDLQLWALASNQEVHVFNTLLQQVTVYKPTLQALPLQYPYPQYEEERRHSTLQAHALLYNGTNHYNAVKFIHRDTTAIAESPQPLPAGNDPSHRRSLRRKRNSEAEDRHQIQANNVVDLVEDMADEPTPPSKRKWRRLRQHRTQTVARLKDDHEVSLPLQQPHTGDGSATHLTAPDIEVAKHTWPGQQIGPPSGPPNPQPHTGAGRAASPKSVPATLAEHTAILLRPAEQLGATSNSAQQGDQAAGDTSTHSPYRHPERLGSTSDIALTGEDASGQLRPTGQHSPTSDIALAGENATSQLRHTEQLSSTSDIALAGEDASGQHRPGKRSQPTLGTENRVRKWPRGPPDK